MNSDEELTDEGKRRREDDEYYSRRSKKTLRTPQKREEENTSRIDQTMKMMKELELDVKDIKKNNIDHETKLRN
ncbi:unnamed protein product [Diabrotica balteata]|uniref:Uncharacterized protein n=1 Tax=Diabrotica balteata TaxID=107213 RepID=A0A9N9XBY0_DIABA|nr:unnamed protein product [Diabrotica balteata]